MLRIPPRLAARILLAIKPKRPPDFVIAPTGEPYMRRWYLIPRNHYFNVYLHRILASDDDRALHDHPWRSVSLMLWGELYELYKAPNGHTHDRFIKAGAIVYRPAEFAHRLELFEDIFARDGGHAGAWTLFITGPNVRAWGFHCPNGWRHWRDFTAGTKGEKIGRGCD